MESTDLIKIGDPGKPRYTLDELLAQCQPDAVMSQEDRDWLDVSPSGREL
jgi:antitoxin ChpS